MYRTKAFRLISCIGFVVFLLGGCERQGVLVEQRFLEFGTIIDITMITDDFASAEESLDQIEQRLADYRQRWHAWEDSDLSRFNRSLADQGSAPVPESLRALLRLSSRYYDASFGLFNPAMGKLIAAYGFQGSEADPEAIARLSHDIPGMPQLVISGDYARSEHADLQIDLGGIAKGYAIGLIADYLDSAGVRHYIVNAGGDMQTAGNRFGRPWRIGIQNPFAPGAIASIELQGKHSLFTSGNYQRYYFLGEKRLHHIIDPSSGEPSMRHSSATILAADPVRADVAATAMMIDGIKRHRELAESLQVQDYLIVSDTREIILSRSFADKISIRSRWPLRIIE